MKQQHLDDELDALSPRLRDLRGQHPGLRVPENYFGSLEAEVFKNLDAIGARRRPAAAGEPGFWSNLKDWLAGFQRPRMVFALAGTAALALAGWWLLRPDATGQPVLAAETELTQEDAEAFVLANVADFDPHQLTSENTADARPEPPQTFPKNRPALAPEDLDNLLDDLSENELEDLL